MSETKPKAAKFKVGQVVMLTMRIGIKQEMPFQILSVMRWNDDWLYEWLGKNYANEGMVRALTADEIGTTDHSIKATVQS